MEKDAPSHRSALRDNKNVLVGSLILVTLMLFGALVYAVFFGPDDATPRDIGKSTLSPRAAPAPTPTSK